MIILGGILVVGAGVDPHGLGFAGLGKATLFVEGNGVLVGDEDALMEVLVFGEEACDNFFADTLALVGGMDEEVGEVDDEVAVGDGIAEADEVFVVPSGDEGVGVEEAFV